MSYLVVNTGSIDIMFDQLHDLIPRNQSVTATFYTTRKNRSSNTQMLTQISEHIFNKKSIYQHSLCLFLQTTKTWILPPHKVATKPHLAKLGEAQLVTFSLIWS